MVIIMYGTLAAVLIVLTMLFAIIIRTRKHHIEIYYLKKSELESIIDSLPDDTPVQILIERNIKCKTLPK